ncbi:MAG: S8 family serine peptidase [Verrucomicrobiota bacterium]
MAEPTFTKKVMRFSAVLLLTTCVAAHASNLDTIGVSLLRQFDPSLQGAGMTVAQVEAPQTTNSPPPFEVNPANVGQPVSLFTYISALGSSATFTNSVGAESGHANTVGANFFGTSVGVAPQISHVNNYEAEYFYNHFIGALVLSPASPSRIVNQSFIFNRDSTVEPDYDDYAAKYNTIFVSGAGFNGQQIFPPATSFNCIAVGVSDDANPPFGPTPDGRCKPDIIAPGTVASFATPHVAGSAAILLQAATRGDGGANTSVATNLITIKTLLLNGAVKPSGWTNSSTRPLDLRYGAGVVNVFNSWNQLKGGKHLPIEMTTITSGAPHPAGSNLNNESSLIGWDYNSLSTTSSQDKINHYYFDLTGTNSYTLTVTLAWNRQQGKTAINNLNLFLYDIPSGNLVAASISAIDNIEHLSLPQLPPGRYDLQVLKEGNAQVTSGETYALAFEFFSLTLQAALTNSESLALVWPVSPAGFHLQSTTNLTAPVSWKPVNATVSVDTNSSQNATIVPINAGQEFFRLKRP